MQVTLKCRWDRQPPQEQNLSGMSYFEPTRQFLQTQRTPIAINRYSIMDAQEPRADRPEPYESAGLPLPCDVSEYACSTDEIPSLLAITCEPPEETRSQSQLTQLDALIHKHKSVFSQDKSDIGEAKLDLPVFHKITLKEGAQPVKTNRPMASYSWTEKQFLKEEAQMLEGLGIIRKSTSPWTSAPVCVKKPDGNLCLCVIFGV